METMENVMNNATEIVTNTVEAVANTTAGVNANYKPMAVFGGVMIIAGIAIDRFVIPTAAKGIRWIAGGIKNGVDKVKDHGYSEVPSQDDNKKNNKK